MGKGTVLESKHRFSKVMREAKCQYSEKLQNQLSANDPSATVWSGLRKINYKPAAPHFINDLWLANQLDKFYC